MPENIERRRAIQNCDNLSSLQETVYVMIKPYIDSVLKAEKRGHVDLSVGHVYDVVGAIFYGKLRAEELGVLDEFTRWSESSGYRTVIDHNARHGTGTEKVPDILGYRPAEVRPIIEDVDERIGRFEGSELRKNPRSHEEFGRFANEIVRLPKWLEGKDDVLRDWYRYETSYIAQMLTDEELKMLSEYHGVEVRRLG